MTIEYQKNIIRYLFQNKTSYLDYISTDLFDTIDLKAIYELFYTYVEKYKGLPDQNNFIQHINNNAQLSTEAIKMLKNNLSWVYDTLRDVTIVEQTILEQVKKKMFKNAIKISNSMIDEGLTSDNIYDIHKRISKITSLRDDNEDDGLFLLKDINKPLKLSDKAYPTFLSVLNGMTAVGGFHPPQIVTFMGPPKSYKTGFMIKFAVEYMKDGLDVFYADFENGDETIMKRAKQSLLECRIDEINNFNSELNQIKQKMLDFTGAGEMHIKKYQKRKDHFGHIETDLNKLLDAGKVNPKFIAYDYIDIMGCSDSKITDKRLQIQQNYADASYINDKYDTFCFTVSKMKASAIDKEWPGPEDVAEDFEKIYNAHAVFAIMRSEEDILDNLGRIIPIVQRMGSSYTKTACVLKVDAEKFIIEQLI